MKNYIQTNEHTLSWRMIASILLLKVAAQERRTTCLKCQLVALMLWRCTNATQPKT